MLYVRMACSGCPGELEVIVDDLEEAEWIACECGYGCVVLAVGEVEPV